jgi:hypothetical protein
LIPGTAVLCPPRQLPQTPRHVLPPRLPHSKRATVQL